MDLYPTFIEGKFTLSDGSQTGFTIDAVLGWQQWGNITEKLGVTVDLIEALEEAANEHGLRVFDDEEDE